MFIIVIGETTSPGSYDEADRAADELNPCSAKYSSSLSLRWVFNKALAALVSAKELDKASNN